MTAIGSPGTGKGLAFEGTLAYIAGNTKGLLIYDASPATPVLLDAFSTVGSPVAVSVQGSLAYLADFPSTLTVVDLVDSGGEPTPTNAPGSTLTPTPTMTPTPTPAGIAGSVHYYTSSSLQMTGAVVQLRDVTVGTGSSAQASSTDGTGQFAFPGIGASNWQVQPSMTGTTFNPADVNDAVAVLEAAVGLRTLGAQQQLACDVSGDGQVDVNDAVLVLQHVVGLLPRFPVAQTCNSDWAFVPEAAAVPNQQVTYPQIATSSCQPNGSVTYRPLAGQANNQNFSAILFGDCLGRWQPGTGAAAAMSVAQSSASVHVGRYPWRSGRRLLVPLKVADGIRAFSVQLRYDSSQLTAVGVRQVGQSGDTLVQTNLRTPGVVNVAVASVRGLPRGQALMLEFTVKDSRSGTPSVRVQRTTAVR